MKQFLTSLLIIASLVFTMTGCDKNKTVRELREKSAELSTYGTKLVTAFGDAYKAGEISQDQLKTLNVASGTFVTALGVYRDAVAQAERIVKSGQPLPADTLGKIERILDDQVVAAFFDILVRVGGLPLAKSEVIRTIISGVRLTILALKSAFSDARHLLNTEEVRHGTMA